MRTQEEILFYLKTRDATAIRTLIRRADEIRREFVGDEVHLRAIVEISNKCEQNCLYCGLRRSRRGLFRYQMDEATILSVAKQVASLGFRTIILQAGEDSSRKAEEIARIIEKLRKHFSLTVTLSLGERSKEDYRMWFAAGAERYLLKQETSDPELYRHLHPGMSLDNRLRCLEALKEIGYQTGSGIIVGLPGQTAESLAEDVLLFRKMDMDMMGIGPFVPNPATPAPSLFRKYPFAYDSEELTYRLIAITRLITQDTMIPTTTALSTVNTEIGRMAGLFCGANVIMPNATPFAFKRWYEIYPRRSGNVLNLESQLASIKELVGNLGRRIAEGPGHRIKRSKAVG